MDENDGVINRLTHSHEVSTLAKSIGTQIYRDSVQPTTSPEDLAKIQSILSTIGLAHDLGNPPFGHQGEAAISEWFLERKDWIFEKEDEQGKDLTHPIPEEVRPEFLAFDGNPQTIRLLSKFKTSTDGDEHGLDLTAAAIAAAIKYAPSASEVAEANVKGEKYGYFCSEQKIVEWARKQTGTGTDRRHQLTWIMEAADDIAYSVLDVEDSMKKRLFSPNDVMAIISAGSDLSTLVQDIKKKFSAVDKLESPEVALDIKIDVLRNAFIDVLVNEAKAAFVDNFKPITDGEAHKNPLLDDSILCKKLKIISRTQVFGHPAVLKREALGAEALKGLMTSFWNAIHAHDLDNHKESKGVGAKNKYVFSLLSRNYLASAVRSESQSQQGTIRYRELRLLTDMVSGMTDTFAIRLWKELKNFI
ncbi:hypothetical protein HDU87_008185 [Geranomyces variabilis]|uniref:HD/PDEase domain-containing protein n=1 Tax=Geranomyces variabilis TaxID=109894 RepID=A0AAD5TIP2_9FUNG|nr:hypothetical protein HDU87_008185 [Geranomyces variabilis]